ncbi:SH3 domain-containing protein [Synechocystis sp. CACIAM 05]|uniref:SH3 domain-containing protein n=1 Tax=Synechocystis sp. CACIAM 05 TaxID=1933929 RepID=UPI00138E89E9|nr:SH3 domain-containing protein [Synechocystis sp. CACIAM 05]QHU98956.1 peptide-binding protein [Synechocystis sp. CACIAM 05]
MVFFKSLFLTSIFCFVLTANPSQAKEICKVTDPTGTPLNVRESPNGKVINALRNNREVEILEIDFDQQGRHWAKVAGYYQGRYRVWGWVIREFISCYKS